MSKTILVVDDSEVVRQQVAAALGAAGYDVVEACDGMAGAEAIESRDDLAAVICDINMPRLNGIEMLTRVKADPKYTALPVVMLTTEGQPALIRRAKEVGAKGWIVKPFDPTLLVSAVRRLAG